MNEGNEDATYTLSKDYNITAYSRRTTIGSIRVVELGLMLREEETTSKSTSFIEGISRGSLILIDGEYFDGLTKFKKLRPPLRVRVSRVAYHHWKSQMGCPLLVKLKEAGIEVDLSLYDGITLVLDS